MLALSLLEGHQLIAKVDAVLTGDVRYFDVVADAVEPVTGFAYACDSWRRSSLCVGFVEAKHFAYGQRAARKNACKDACAA
jgi:hypothetical protein